MFHRNLFGVGKGGLWSILSLESDHPKCGEPTRTSSKHFRGMLFSAKTPLKTKFLRDYGPLHLFPIYHLFPSCINRRKSAPEAQFVSVARRQHLAVPRPEMSMSAGKQTILSPIPPSPRISLFPRGENSGQLPPIPNWRGLRDNSLDSLLEAHRLMVNGRSERGDIVCWRVHGLFWVY